MSETWALCRQLDCLNSRLTVERQTGQREGCQTCNKVPQLELKLGRCGCVVWVWTIVLSGHHVTAQVYWYGPEGKYLYFVIKYKGNQPVVFVTWKNKTWKMFKKHINSEGIFYFWPPDLELKLKSHPEVQLVIFYYIKLFCNLKHKKVNETESK